MGISLETILKMAENFKEKLWYFFDCKEGVISKEKSQAIKDKLNDLIDELEGLK